MSKYRKLGRPTDQRIAMLKNLTTSLFKNGKILTTVCRAKELRKLIDKIINLAKKNTLHSRRQIMKIVTIESVVTELFSNLSKYQSRSSGYSKIVKIGPRRGDGAEMCLIELIDITNE
ncbi:MAG: 50S ribosomal protein L17 [Clostridiales bacterium]|jgi:large subunit ribosomal protein L17|nr:50S ribosomal protein L17 [Clostridiales bacterium]